MNPSKLCGRASDGAISAKWNVLSSILAFALVVGLLTYKLPSWPVIWYDEGYNLQAADNLARFGRYGLRTPEGFSDFDPLLITGPTVAGPIALAFSLLGTDLTWARLVMVVFALMALVALFGTARRVFDGKTALVACMLLLATPLYGEDTSASFIGLSRMAMGEVPALLFVLMGVFIWFQGLERDSRPLLAGSGLLFGLAVITKPHCLLVLAAFGFAWVVDRLWHHHVRWSPFVLPLVTCLACAALWYGAQSFASGSGLFDPVASRLGTQLALASPRQIVRNLRALLASGSLTWGLPGLAYGAYLCKSRTLVGLQRAFLVLFSLIWLSWFVLGSIGWLRYALLPLAITGIFSAKLLADLADGFSISWRALREAGHSDGEARKCARALAVTAAIAIMVFAPLQRTARDILLSDDQSPYEFSSYLDANIPGGVAIASFESEIAFLSDHLFFRPSLVLETAAIRHVQMDLPYPPGARDLDEVDPAYVVDGPMSKWTELYAEELRTGRYVLVVSIGPYDLYRAAEAADPVLP